MCHVSTKESMEYIINAKLLGANVTCEVTPHHIALTRDVNDYNRVNPPTREKEDVAYLINAIKHGMVDCIGDRLMHLILKKKRRRGHQEW